MLSRYQYKEALKYLRTFETIIFMKKRKLGGIATIQGWDAGKEELIIKSVQIRPKRLKDYLIAG